MDIRPYLPSRHFSLLVGSFVLAGLLVYGASFFGKGGTVDSFVATSERSNIGGADSDADGLADWEEAIRGTNRDNPDSDEDGTLDKEEIELGRNPLKAGPNDSTVSKEDEKFIADLIAAASSTNLTEGVSQTLFAKYIQARKDGSSGDSQTQEQLVQDSIANANVPLRGKMYTIADLTVTNNENETIKTFANTSVRIMRAYPDATFAETVRALSIAIDNNDPRAKERLLTIGRAYQNTARDLAKVPVPESYAQIYLKCINVLENAGASFEDMAVVIEDPVRAVAGLKNYNIMITIGTEFFANIAADMVRKNISFKKDDPGVEWQLYLATVAI